jgi:2-dehydro-3-deoxygalactonokinase
MVGAGCATYAIVQGSFLLFCLSGLLLGTDCRARMERGQTVHLLADGLLARLYSAAIAIAGGEAVVVDSHAAFVAGITQIRDTKS